MGFGKWIEIDFFCIKISRNMDPTCGAEAT